MRSIFFGMSSDNMPVSFASGRYFERSERALPLNLRPSHNIFCIFFGIEGMQK